MFNGEATDNELTQIRQWVNADKANRETFYHERALFDALQLNSFQKENHVRKQSVPLWKWIGGAAAAARRGTVVAAVARGRPGNRPALVAAAGAGAAGPNPGQDAGPAPEGFNGDDVVDGDYKEV